MGTILKSKTLVGATFMIICLIYAIVSMQIWFVAPSKDKKANDLAVEGKLIWQNNNCTACHQIYGLGGYLGPDLTNITSLPGKNKQYIKSITQSGIKQMPSYHLSEIEMDKLYAFLEQFHVTGEYNPAKQQVTDLGMTMP